MELARVLSTLLASLMRPHSVPSTSSGENWLDLWPVPGWGCCILWLSWHISWVICVMEASRILSSSPWGETYGFVLSPEHKKAQKGTGTESMPLETLLSGLLTGNYVQVEMASSAPRKPHSQIPLRLFLWMLMWRQHLTSKTSTEWKGNCTLYDRSRETCTTAQAGCLK